MQWLIPTCMPQRRRKFYLNEPNHLIISSHFPSLWSSAHSLMWSVLLSEMKVGDSPSSPVSCSPWPVSQSSPCWYTLLSHHSLSVFQLLCNITSMSVTHPLIHHIQEFQDKSGLMMVWFWRFLKLLSLTTEIEDTVWDQGDRLYQECTVVVTRARISSSTSSTLTTPVLTMWLEHVTSGGRH